jgi:calcineurin-like phosphoesterase family protein
VHTRDWYDDYILEAENVNLYLISDTHLKHDKMTTYCDRPSNFTELVHKNVMNTVKPTDTLIHLGDVGIGKHDAWEWMIQAWPGRKILIRGNHDRAHSCGWWSQHGFHFACDSLVIRNVLLTHEPANAVIKSDGHRPYGALEESLPEGSVVNVHGHLHNIWDGFHSPERIQRDKELLGIDFTKRLKHPWQRLFALEYTNYGPVEFNKFLANPDKYQAKGPRPKKFSEVRDQLILPAEEV